MPDALHWTNPKRPFGFRFSLRDLLVTLAVAGLTWGLVHWRGALGWLPAVVLGHFFLFCNVFGIGNRRELIWAAVFIVNALAWSLTGSVRWGPILLTQTPVTALLCLRAIFDPRYRGIFCRPPRPADQEAGG